MVEQLKSDMVMRFMLNGRDVAAECALEVDPDDKFMTDFHAAESYDDYTNFFEVTSFDYTLKVSEEDESIGALGGQGGQGGLTTTRLQGTRGMHAANAGFSTATPRVAGAFARWRSATDEQLKEIKYPVVVDRISFERFIDSASPIFFSACCNSQSFDSAVMVKRLSPGGSIDKYRQPVGFIRIEFTDVLITGVEWNDGDVIKEKCEFICRKMVTKYKRYVRADGTLVPIPPAEWEQGRDAGS